jgi:hypothetical protein
LLFERVGALRESLRFVHPFFSWTGGYPGEPNRSRTIASTGPACGDLRRSEQ